MNPLFAYWYFYKLYLGVIIHGTQLTTLFPPTLRWARTHQPVRKTTYGEDRKEPTTGLCAYGGINS